MSKRIEIGYVCRHGHFQFRDDPDGDTCGTKNVATIYAETRNYPRRALEQTINHALTSLHQKIEFWRNNS